MYIACVPRVLNIFKVMKIAAKLLHYNIKVQRIEGTKKMD